MKLIIIEGTDNTGKDTLISKLIEKYPTVTLIHCGKPFSKVYSSYEQDALFNIYADNIVNKLYDNTHVIIMNRSHIGEYVYGTLYRNRDTDDVIKMIQNIESKLLMRRDLDVRYIQLICTSENLLRSNEDGHSLSNGDANSIMKETSLFTDIFNVSALKKLLVRVNNGNTFRTRESIFKEVYNFIEE